MVYTNRHLYLTIHWKPNTTGEEVGQVGLRFDAPTNDALPTLVANAAPIVQTFWTAANSGIEGEFDLTYLRLAIIGTDGKYWPDSVAADHTYPAGVAGGGGTTIGRFPLQMALVATLNTAKPRGRASKGRIYLPWYNTALDSSYRYPSASVNARSVTLATMITGLNGVMGWPASVMSKVGSGTKEVITGVSHGTRPDVQRRRADQLPDPRGTISAVTGP